MTPRDTGPWTDHCREEKLIRPLSRREAHQLLLTSWHHSFFARTPHTYQHTSTRQRVRRIWRTWCETDLATRCQDECDDDVAPGGYDDAVSDGFDDNVAPDGDDGDDDVVTSGERSSAAHPPIDGAGDTNCKGETRAGMSNVVRPGGSTRLRPDPKTRPSDPTTHSSSSSGHAPSSSYPSKLGLTPTCWVAHTCQV